MTLQESLKDDLKNAMKARDTDRTGAIRILMGEFARQSEKTVSDEQVIAIIKLWRNIYPGRQAKKRFDPGFSRILIFLHLPIRCRR